MGFPFEIITMLASTVLGGLMSVWAESRKAKAEQQKLLITRGEFEMKARKQSIEAGQADKGFAWTRRIIALTSVTFTKVGCCILSRCISNCWIYKLESRLLVLERRERDI